FCQAEDGIRDFHVTGVQSCALPILLRAKPPGQLLKSAHQVDREYRVMKALAGTNVPVPRVLHLSGEGEASPIGRMFYVMAYVDRSEERRVGREGRCRPPADRR